MSQLSAEVACAVQRAKGWTDAELLGHVLGYVGNQGDDDAFNDYLWEQQEANGSPQPAATPIMLTMDGRTVFNPRHVPALLLSDREKVGSPTGARQWAVVAHGVRTEVLAPGWMDSEQQARELFSTLALAMTP